MPVVVLYVISIAVALALCALLVSATGGSASEVFSALLDGSLRSPGSVGPHRQHRRPAARASPPARSSAGKAGLSNIGQEGQVLIGAAGTAYVATRLEAPGFFVIVASLAGGVACSAACGRCSPSVMKFTRNVPEVISTLLLYFIAIQITDYGLTKRWLLASLSTDSRVNNGRADQVRRRPAEHRASSATSCRGAP